MLTKESVPMARGLCQMTLLEKDCMMAALRAGKGCLPRAAAMAKKRVRVCEGELWKTGWKTVLLK